MEKRTQEEDNAIYASTLYWEAEKRQKQADDAYEKLIEFMKGNKVDLRKYMFLTRTPEEAYEKEEATANN
jgi:hypothetical protein